MHAKVGNQTLHYSQSSDENVRKPHQGLPPLLGCGIRLLTLTLPFLGFNFLDISPINLYFLIGDSSG